MQLSLGLTGARPTGPIEPLETVLEIWGAEGGVVSAGDTLTASDVGVQWQRNGADIPGAVASTYAIADVDRGAVIRVVDGVDGTRASIGIDVTGIVTVASDPSLVATTITLVSGQIAGWGAFDGVTLTGNVPAGSNTTLVFQVSNTGGSTSFAFEVTGNAIIAAAQDIKNYVDAGALSNATIATGPVTEGDMLVFIAEQKQGVPFVASDFPSGILREASATSAQQVFTGLWTYKVTASMANLDLLLARDSRSFVMFNIGAHDFIASDIQLTNGYTAPNTVHTYSTIPIVANAKVLRTHIVRDAQGIDLVPPTVLTEPFLDADNTVSNGVWDNSVTWKTESPTVGTDSLLHTAAQTSDSNSGITRIQASFAPVAASAYVPMGLYAEDENGDGVDSTPLARSSMSNEIKIEEVTVTLSDTAQVGHYHKNSGNLGLGDVWVKGPITITGYTPAYVVDVDGRTKNGAMLNVEHFVGGATLPERQGFDSYTASGRAETPAYDNATRAALPINMVAGDTLVIAVSLDTPLIDMGTSHRRFLSILNLVTITCVADVPYADALRPNYCGHSSVPRLEYRVSDLDTSLLPSYPQMGTVPAKEDMYAQWSRFHFDVVTSWYRKGMRADKLKGVYGRDLTIAENDSLAYLTSDATLEEKLPILIGYAQRGIDSYGVIQSAQAQGNNSVWDADGGWSMGRLPAIMFAEHLLGETWSYAGDWQETNQVFEVDQYTVDFTNDADYSNDKANASPYTAGMIGMPEWVVTGGKSATPTVYFGSSWTNGPNFYRLLNNHDIMQGQTILMASFGDAFKVRFDRDVYFDYAARHLEVEQTGADTFRFRGGATELYAMVDEAPVPKVFVSDTYAMAMLNAHYGTAGYQYPWSNAGSDPWVPLT